MIGVTQKIIHELHKVSKKNHWTVGDLYLNKVWSWKYTLEFEKPDVFIPSTDSEWYQGPSDGWKYRICCEFWSRSSGYEWLWITLFWRKHRLLTSGNCMARHEITPWYVSADAPKPADDFTMLYGKIMEVDNKSIVRNSKNESTTKNLLKVKQWNIEQKNFWTKILQHWIVQIYRKLNTNLQKPRNIRFQSLRYLSFVQEIVSHLKTVTQFISHSSTKTTSSKVSSNVMPNTWQT